jgi:hypothetical protein
MILLTNSLHYPIQPSHIASHGPTLTGLDKESEAAARWIVWFCRDRNNGWQPIRRSEFRTFLRAMGVSEFSFASLPGKLVHLTKHTCTLTHEFVSLCFKASPTNIL